MVVPAVSVLLGAWLLVACGQTPARADVQAGAPVADRPTYVPGVAAWPNGKGFNVVYRTFEGNVALRTLREGVWSATPVNLGGNIVGGPSITFAARNPHVYGRGTDGALWERVRVNGTWRPWTKIGGRLLSAAPAAVGRPNGRVDVFIRDVHDRLQTRTYLPGSGWGAWRLLGGVLHSAPAAALTGADSLRVVATGNDATVRTRTLTGGTWSAWTSLGGATHTSPGIAADPATGHTWLFLRDTSAEARLRMKTFTGSWSGWRVVGGTYVDGPAAAHGGGKTVVMARGRNGALWYRTVTGTTWSSRQRAWTPGPPTGVPPALRGRNVTVLPTTSKVVALTFDGAWSAAGVASIRATLQRQNVPATFFMVGAFARLFPAKAALLAGSGFRVGNHSNGHPDFTKIDDIAARTEVTAARTSIFNVTGADPRPLFRFPYGAHTSSGIRLLNGLGYVCVGWTVDSLGWKGTSGGQSADKVVARVLNAARPGMIVLMHVGSNPDDGTVLDADALPRIIRGLRDRGYSFVTLDALLA